MTEAEKGLSLLASGALLPDSNMLITPDTTNQLNDLFTQFFADPSISAEDAQAKTFDRYHRKRGLIPASHASPFRN